MGFNFYSKSKKFLRILSLFYNQVTGKNASSFFLFFYTLLLMNAILVFERYLLMFRGNMVNKRRKVKVEVNKHTGLINSVS